jgi:glycerol-3-phosphate acyltransferase PlsX
MAIILDAMGSDNYPDPEISGAIEASKLIDEEIVLVGNREILESKLTNTSSGIGKISIEHAPEVVEMWDKPVASAKNKPNNSMAVGIKKIKDNPDNAFVTAGNTGGAMFNALRVLGRIKGVQRPALTGTFPTMIGKSIVVDIGANADCRPDFLVQFAIMGSLYAELALGKVNPKIAILSNGEESGKGNQLVKDTSKLLEISNLNFIGNIEPKELFAGEADVIITDGFTGNILVKTSEAVAKMITDTLKESLMDSFRTKIGAVFAKPAFSKVKSLIDPSEIGAAPLLGVDGLVFVGHGRSDTKAIVSSILLAERTLKSGLLQKIRVGINQKLN